MLTKLRRLVATYGLVDTLCSVVTRVVNTCLNRPFLWATGVRIGRGVVFEGLVHIHGGPRVTIGDFVRLGTGVVIDAGSTGQVLIGPQTYVGRFSTIIASERVQFGPDCLVSPFCYVIDSDHGLCADELIRTQDYQVKPVVVGSDVWIGVGSTILKGVSIGDGAVVGARSVVTHDVQVYTVVAGAPARVIRRRSGGASHGKPTLRDESSVRAALIEGVGRVISPTPGVRELTRGAGGPASTAAIPPETGESEEKTAPGVPSQDA